ncbi:FAD binding domain-containing protein [Wukongibacter baidiensis]|uniref:FAD binding domain-containing protein n=1 Tax=Wukongibacter baidiensis TaxID=1723361 RepID=UPI003D7F77B4
MHSFDVLAPKDITELKEALGKATSESKILAGGTDLVVAIHEGHSTPDLVIDISGIDELKSISHEDDYIYIGSGVTFAEIEKSSIIKKHGNCLVEAASQVGSTQIRNLGTIGGNIANASPAGDCITALVALEAVVQVMDKEGKITDISIGELIVGANKLILKEDQVIRTIKFKIVDESYRSGFVKVGTRSAVTISKANIAVLAKVNEESNEIEYIRIALGAVGKKSFRDFRAEEALRGRVIDNKLRSIFADEISKTVQESIKGRSSMPYKKEAVKGLTDSIFDKLFYR